MKLSNKRDFWRVLFYKMDNLGLLLYNMGNWVVFSHKKNILVEVRKAAMAKVFSEAKNISREVMMTDLGEVFSELGNIMNAVIKGSMQGSSCSRRTIGVLLQGFRRISWWVGWKTSFQGRGVDNGHASSGLVLVDEGGNIIEPQSGVGQLYEGTTAVIQHEAVAHLDDADGQAAGAGGGELQLGGGRPNGQEAELGRQAETAVHHVLLGVIKVYLMMSLYSLVLVDQGYSAGWWCSTASKM